MGGIVKIFIKPRPLKGSLPAIPSKSQAHRALICAALSANESQVALESSSEDIQATRRALSILQGGSVADCGESGTTLRLLVPVAAALGLAVTFTGAGRLPQRPMEPLLSLLEEKGCRISAPNLPFSLRGQLQPGHYSIPGHISSQYVSGLLLALPLLAGDSRLVLTSPLESGPYVAMTLDVMARFGVQVQEEEAGWRIAGGQTYRGEGVFSVEGDWSNAAFWLVAAALGSPVQVTGLKEDSLQGDRAIVDLIRRRPDTIDVREIPDLVPILAVLACSRRATTRITGAGRLRLKESDRIASTRAMIQALGGSVCLEGDDLLIQGQGSLEGGTVQGFGDHRIVMAAAIAALLCRQPVLIEGAQAAHKSYPAFFDHYRSLGGDVHVL